MISLADGVRIETASGPDVVADGRGRPDDVTVVSHAHLDHVPGRTEAPVVCSDLTAGLARARTGRDFQRAADVPGLSLLPSGHVLGSRAALVDDGERRVLYTGDVSTRDRLYLDGFEPVPADVLVVESTYGTSAYRFPPHAEVRRAVADWVADAGGPVVLFGYPLGRAQKLIALLSAHTTADRIAADGTIRELNAVVEVHTDLRFSSESFDPAGAYGPGDAIVLSTARSRDPAVARLVERTGAVTAGFSGWAVGGRFRFGAAYDATFPLSDHCDFDELVALVRAVDPEVVYTHHGFAEAFAAHLRTEHGYDALPLVRNQTSLSEFG